MAKSKLETRRRRRGPRRSSVAVRLVVLGVACLIGLLYLQPIRSYVKARDVLATRQAEVRALQLEQRTLRRRVAESTNGVALLREARRLGLVRPGERLFVVKGIDAWRRASGRRATIAEDG